MTTITLTPDLEEVLTREAQRRGTSPERLVLDNLRRQCLPAPEVAEGGTAYDSLKDFVGVIHSGEYVAGGAKLSERTGEKFAEGLLQKQREGRL